MRADAFEIDGVVATRETDKALLVTVDGKQAWVPKSHIHDDSEVWMPGHEGKLVVSQWIAEEKGWC